MFRRWSNTLSIRWYVAEALYSILSIREFCYINKKEMLHTYATRFLCPYYLQAPHTQAILMLAIQISLWYALLKT